MIKKRWTVYSYSVLRSTRPKLLYEKYVCFPQSRMRESAIHEHSLTSSFKVTFYKPLTAQVSVCPRSPNPGAHRILLSFWFRALRKSRHPLFWKIPFWCFYDSNSEALSEIHSRHRVWRNPTRIRIPRIEKPLENLISRHPIFMLSWFWKYRVVTWAPKSTT